MKLTQIIGQNDIKKSLIENAQRGRIPHAQLFIGPDGSGTLPMAIAYAKHILCSSKTDSASYEACNLKLTNLSHPDLHFVFPVSTTEQIKKNPSSDQFLAQWISFLKQNAYGNLFDWYTHIDIQNKQGQIGVDEALQITKKLALKSYEGGYKVMIIWMADKLNIEASNKLLKLLEEPPSKTVFLLIAENQKNILPTILSRCQIINFPVLDTQDIATALMQQYTCSQQQALSISKQAQGNYNKALKLLKDKDKVAPFEKWFVQWVRAAFKAKGNPAIVQDLILWSEELSSLGREEQKQFLEFCIELFRQALLCNYKTTNLVHYQTTVENFHIEKFAPFVNGSNIIPIYQELSQAIYHIERNGSSKMIFMDLSLKLTRLIHRK